MSGLQALVFVGAAMSITLVVMTIATTLIAYPLLEWCIAESTPLVASHASTRHSPTHPRDHVK